MALLDATTTVLVGLVLIVAGLVLAFYGAGLVRVLMAVLGALIGGAFGFLGGTLLGGTPFPLIFGIVGAIVGIVLFGFLVRFAVSLAAGVIAGGMTFILVGGVAEPGASIPLASFAFAFVAFLVAAILIFLLFNRLLGLITALVGGLLVGVSLNFVSVNLGALTPQIALAIGVVGGVVIFLAGAFRQAKAASD